MSTSAPVWAIAMLLIAAPARAVAEPSILLTGRIAGTNRQVQVESSPFDGEDGRLYVYLWTGDSERQAEYPIHGGMRRLDPRTRLWCNLFEAGRDREIIRVGLPVTPGGTATIQIGQAEPQAIEAVRAPALRHVYLGHHRNVYRVVVRREGEGTYAREWLLLWGLPGRSVRTRLPVIHHTRVRREDGIEEDVVEARGHAAVVIIRANEDTTQRRATVSIDRAPGVPLVLVDH